MPESTNELFLGAEVGTGAAVTIPNRHMAVTGQTQESGKTTTLEALVSRRLGRTLAFITKRGEKSFAEGTRIRPYFRDRADWQFVTSLLDATLQEKNKFLRPWIMKICRTTRTLADVQVAVRDALKTAKGLNEGVYTQLDAYLDLVVPDIARADLDTTLDIDPRVGATNLRVMDVSSFSTPMQMLFMQSALDWVNEHASDTVVVIPEAWEFIPETKGSPVKQSAISLVRKGGGLGNRIWVDSQDMAGVDKTILRGCTVWLIGVQREANEIKRNLGNIPAGIQRPKPADIARLERGQFYACWKDRTVKVYVCPSWMSPDDAHLIAIGAKEQPQPPIRIIAQPTKEPTLNESEAKELRRENLELRAEVDRLRLQVTGSGRSVEPQPATSFTAATSLDLSAAYDVFKTRMLADAKKDPALIKVLMQKPEILVEVERVVITVDGSSLKGRVARLLATGFFRDPQTQGRTRTELKKTGPDINTGSLSTLFGALVTDGFLTKLGDDYTEVAGMKARIVDK